MKILFINRSKEYGGHSVEELFNTLKKELTEIEYYDYYYNENLSVIRNIRNIKKFKVDIYHLTSGKSNLLYFLPTHKTIFTLHDINRYLYNLKGLRKLLYYLIYLYPLKKTNYITTISETVKKTAIKELCLNENNIHVIHNCFPNDFPSTTYQFNQTKPNILTIGTQYWKNLETLITSLKNINCKLTIIGKINNTQKTLLESYSIDFENHINITRSEMYLCYKNSDIVMFISLYEGFGMPIIEAQQVGRPVITSNISSMPEIANDSACLVNPLNIVEIENAINLVINDSSYRNQLINKGFKNIKRFSPEVIKRKYLNLYEKVYKKM